MGWGWLNGGRGLNGGWAGANKGAERVYTSLTQEMALVSGRGGAGGDARRDEKMKN